MVTGCEVIMTMKALLHAQPALSVACMEGRTHHNFHGNAAKKPNFGKEKSVSRPFKTYSVQKYLLRLLIDLLPLAGRGAISCCACSPCLLGTSHGLFKIENRSRSHALSPWNLPILGRRSLDSSMRGATWTFICA